MKMLIRIVDCSAYWAVKLLPIAVCVAIAAIFAKESYWMYEFQKSIPDCSK